MAASFSAISASQEAWAAVSDSVSAIEAAVMLVEISFNLSTTL